MLSVFLNVQVLNFDSFTWSTVSSKVYLSPSSLPLMIPSWKGHCLVILIVCFVVLYLLVLIVFFNPFVRSLGVKKCYWLVEKQIPAVIEFQVSLCCLTFQSLDFFYVKSLLKMVLYVCIHYLQFGHLILNPNAGH